jgi:hypothetical protein
MTKVLALASEDPSQFYLGDREVTVEERRSHRGGTHLRGRPTLHSSMHMRDMALAGHGLACHSSSSPL